MRNNFKIIFFILVCFILFFNITVTAQDSIPNIATPISPVTPPSTIGQDPAPRVDNAGVENNTNTAEATTIIPTMNQPSQRGYVEKIDPELIAAMENNPFRLIHDGKQKRIKPRKGSLAISSGDIKKTNKENKEEKVKKIVEEVEEVYVAVDTTTAALERQNPFRLEGTLDERKTGLATKKIKFNPKAGSGAKRTPSNTFNPIFDTSKVDVNPLGTLKFTIIILLLGFLTIIMTRFRSEVNDIYKAFLNQNLMSLLYREKGTILRLPYILLYMLSVFSIGTMIFLTTSVFGIKISGSNFTSFAICLAGAAGIYLGRHTSLWLLAYIFPFSKEAKLYSFVIAIFNFVIGIVLLPYIIFIAFAATNTHTILLYMALFSVLILYVFRVIRSLLIMNKYLTHNKFHFFMYLCTVEIAPILILLKLIGF
jgi:hypothetical protein